MLEDDADQRASHLGAYSNYWTNVTDGYLDFVGSTLFPWVDIQIGADDVSRETQCARAYEATGLPRSA